jgi:hypothetical protein
MIKQNKAQKIVLFIYLLNIFGISGIAYAANIFTSEMFVCTPSWYCTEYSGGNCGARSCIDVNACGINIDKPSEFLQCEESKNNESSDELQENYTSSVMNELQPVGYFTTDSDVMPIHIEQGEVIQKIISLNANLPEEYTLEIEYPSSYTKVTEFITTSNNKKNITNIGDFNIIVDSRSILSGTYIVPIKISNKYYSKTIEAIIEIASSDSPKMELSIDSKIKRIDEDTTITSHLSLDDIKLKAGENVTYSILDPSGNIIYSEDRVVINPPNIDATIILPKGIVEGYYVLAVKVNTQSKEYSKSIIFTFLSPNKYQPIVEAPEKRHNNTEKTIFVIAAIITILLIIMHIITKDKPGRRRSGRNTLSHKILMSKPLVGITFNFQEKIREMSEKWKRPEKIEKGYKTNEKEQLRLLQRRNEILKSTYERGFISLTEYSNAIYAQNHPLDLEKEHIRREEERLKKEKDRREQEKKKEEEHIKDMERKIAEKQREDKEKEETKRKEDKKKEEERLRIEEERKEKSRIEEKEFLKALEQKEEKIIEKIVEKMDKKEHAEDIKEENNKIKSLEKKTEGIVEKIEEKKVINVHSDILDKRARDSEVFVLSNNQLLYSLRDLLNVLPNMPEHVFHHHTMHGRNDFANWTGDVFHYDDVAEEIRHAINKEDLIERLKQYE